MTPLHYRAKVAAVCGFSLLLLLPMAFGGAERIQPGDTRDAVVQELGSSFALMKFGAFETLVYKDGTSVSLKNGLVTEVHPGKQVVTDFRTAAGPHQVPAAASQNERSQNRPEATKPAQKEGNALARVEIKPGVPKPAAGLVPLDEKQKPPTPDIKLPSRSVQAVAQPTRPATAGLSTNLAPFSISRTSGRIPIVISFSGGSGKTFNPVVALTWLFRLGRWLALLFLGLIIGLYVFACHCYSRICEKAREEPGVLIWIPLVQFVPLLRVAQMPPWTVILLIVPLINIVLIFTLWAKICVALGKTPWLVLLLLVPIANLGLIVYLAFCDAAAQPPRLKDSFVSQARQPEPAAV
jgi:hypothetical protein